MNIGMLWFDNDPKADLLTKIHRAAQFYQSKYGRPPNCCIVHPSMMPKSQHLEAGRLVVQSAAMILPNHFWLGITRAEPVDAGSTD